MKNLDWSSQRPYSIRTRIKTGYAQLNPVEYFVRDHIPLEQGLRHHTDVRQELWPCVRDHIPLEQGLRRLCQIWVRRFVSQRPYSIRTRIKT